MSNETTPESRPSAGDEPFAASELEAIEKHTQRIGRYLFDHLDEEHPHILQRRWWDDRVMSWAMQDEALKVQLFRFVDVLPMLRTSEAVTAHLNEYLAQVRDRLPSAVGVAIGAARRTPVVRAAVARAARLTATDFARRFIAGANVREVLAAAKRERDNSRGFTLDILGEAVTSGVESERYFEAYVKLIEEIAPAVNAWPEAPLIDTGVLGELPRMNLSIKLSALDCRFDAIDTQGVARRVGGRLAELLRVARRYKAFINVDMESYDKKDLTLHIFKQVLSEEEFADVGDVGIVVQCYLRDALDDLAALRDWAARRGKPVWVRLVKGAYWDYETVHAKAAGWPIPVFQQKWQSDLSFERAVHFIMRNHQHLRPALGSHNIRSLAYGAAVAEHLGLPKNGYEFQMLYGMGDAEKHALVAAGHRLRIYMPYGELIPGMAYLVRRLLENTSNDSFVRPGFLEHASPDQLLMPPEKACATFQQRPNGGDESQSADTDQDVEEDPEMNSNADGESLAADFPNEPHVDFAREENRAAMASALQAVAKRFGAEYPLVIGGTSIETGEWIESVDPSQSDRVVGRVAQASADHAQQAVKAAREALPAWAALDASQRGDHLRRAAQMMRERRFELAAWQVYECGKPWREATADVDEATDFCEFYAQEAAALEQPAGADVPGEQNRFIYVPRGVAAIIAPWNFPLAILTGMTAAALATGNTAIMKPAEQSSVIAALLMEILAEARFPPGVVNFLPGQGETVGAALVEHPDVALIAFTGSRHVGLAINRRAAEVSAAGAPFVKKVIAEMGGKNAIIVDSDADLDEAVAGVVKSAFGYSGQKCSACSRAIVLNDVYDAFLERVVEAARSLQVGPAEEPATDVGPVIDDQSRAKVRQFIEIGRREAREVLAVDVGELAGRGSFVGPHIFADAPPAGRLCQEEIFGPVLALIRAADFEEALRIANDVDYALTGGVYSRSPANLQRARRELMVGNLYLNRNITGALVGRQPFGGFRMSGIGSKAGGKDYLLQFMLPRTITENTMRRGFAPDAD